VADDFALAGLEQFKKLSKDLREAGDKDMRRELYRGLQRATKPLKVAAKESAGQVLPTRGGLADRVQRARYNTKSRAGNNPSVRIEAKDAKGRAVDLEALDRGTVRHPTYGRKPWVNQRVTPGWFTQPMQDGATEVRVEIVRAIDAVARKFYNQ
jgi:hypothetical protein